MFKMFHHTRLEINRKEYRSCYRHPDRGLFWSST